MHFALSRAVGQKPALAVLYFGPSLIPVCLLLSGAIPITPGYRNFLVLSSVFAFAAVITMQRIRRGDWVWKDIGVSRHGFRKALRFYALWSCIAIAVFSIIAGIVRPIRTNIDEETIILYSIFGSVLQECLYRAYLWKIGEELFRNERLNFWMNVTVFTLMHCIFGNTLEERFMIMGMIFPVGVLFAYLYASYRSLPLIAAAHIIANALGVLSGIFN